VTAGSGYYLSLHVVRSGIPVSSAAFSVCPDDFLFLLLNHQPLPASPSTILEIIFSTIHVFQPPFCAGYDAGQEPEQNQITAIVPKITGLNSSICIS
jgi:hypothetical protein